MKKSIRNINAVTYKLGLILIKTMKYRLKVVKEERQKRQEIIKKQKTEAMVAKQYRARGRISSSSKKEYENTIEDNMGPD